MCRLGSFGVVSMAVIAALVMTAVTPPDAAAALAADPVPRRTVQDLPGGGELSPSQARLLEMPSEPLPEAKSRMPRGDFSLSGFVPSEADLALETVPSEKVKEVDWEALLKEGALPVAGQDAFSTTYKRGEGSFITRTSDTPENVQRADGSWAPVATDVAARDGGWEVKDHPLSPQFPESAGDAVTVTNAGHTLSYTLRDASSATGKASGSELVFRGAQPGVDVQYDIERATVKETLVLESAPENPTWTWEIRTDSLTPQLTEWGDVQFLDGDGTVVFTVPTPVAWDSSGVEEKSSDSLVNPTASVAEAGDGVWAYTVAVDPEWLNAKERVFPVFVDPSVYPWVTYQRSFKSDGAVMLNETHVGNTRQGYQDVYWRGFADYATAGAAYTFVADAQLYVQYDGIGTTSSQWGNLYMGFGQCFSCTGDWLANYVIDTGGSWIPSAGISQHVANRYSVGDDKPAFIWAGNEAPGVYSHKRVATAMYLAWWHFPTISQVAPADGAAQQSVTPTLSVTSAEYSEQSDLKYHKYVVSASASMADPVWDSGWVTSTTVKVPESKLQPGTTYYWRATVKDAHSGHLSQSTERSTGVRSFTTQVTPPTPPVGTASPGNPDSPQVLTTLTPTLQVDAVTDPDGFPASSTVKYEFKVATGMDGKSGTVVTSGLLSPDVDGKVRWQVPPGTLKDGTIYAWIVQPFDGLDKNTLPAWSMKLKVDMRLGSSGPSPFDSAGPVTVNLANGNAHLSFSSPLVSTLGGPMGMSFAYNSQDVQNARRGVVGTFYDARNLGVAPLVAADYYFTGKTALHVQTESGVNFNWPAEPAPAVPADHFLSRWTGNIQVPVAGNWKFGVHSDGGVRLTVGGSTLDRWVEGAHTLVLQPSATARAAGEIVPFTLEAYEHTGGSHLELWADNLSDSSPAVLIPPDWYTTELITLPAGWGSSVPIAGGTSPWVKASISESSVALTDASGTAHTHTRTSTGGYAPPAGEHGVVSLDGLGRIVYTDEAGTVHQFAADGRLETATPSADGVKPASPVSIRNANGYVTSIVDPVSKDGSVYHRKVQLMYQGVGSGCPSTSGSHAPPGGMLCQIVYPDSGGDLNKTTNLYYNATGQLWMIEDPGGERTTFGYTDGVISKVRDAVANDWLLAQSPPPANAKTETDVFYTGNRVSYISLPPADGAEGSDRLRRNYAYGTGTTTISQQGASTIATTVAYDATWRQASTTSALGVSTSQEWHPTKDLVLSTTTSAGLMSTTLYDPVTDRPTDSYGPAAAACFQPSRLPVADPVGTAGCGIVPVHSTMTYDGGLNGLQATYYPNPNLAGKPALFALGIGGSGGTVDRSWGTASPGTGIGADNWSVRLTGLVTFPTAGDHTFVTNSDDGARVWIDDVLVTDKWSAGVAEHAGLTLTGITAGETRRIRVEMFEGTGSALLQLKWKQGTGAATVVPGTALRPDYGLVTQSAVDDATSVAGAAAPGIATSSSYQHPWLGQATESVLDPAGLALSTKVTYEPSGASGWLRRLTRVLPAATVSDAPSTAKTTTAYYGDLEGAPSEQSCVTTGTKQFGFAKSTTAPVPASGSAVTTEYVYDIWGRTAGTKVSGDADWSCVTFDARGRTVSQTYPATAAAPARTTTAVYTSVAAGMKVETFDGTAPVGGNGSTVTAVTDLIGRAVTYIDAWGTVTTPTYAANTGRVSSVSTTAPGQSAVVTAFTYDLDGKVKTVKVGSQTLATVTHNAAQLLASVAYLGGHGLTAVTRDPALRTTGHSWTVGTANVTDQVARSVSGRVVQHTSTLGTTARSSTFGYDTAGRLVSASIPGHELSYEFAGTGGCGVNPAAGLSGNRSKVTDVWSKPGDTAKTTTTSYCYDWADRLTSSTVTGAISGAHKVADGLTASEITYDARGNMTRLADMVFGYDGAGRHVKTTYDSGDVVTLARDVTGRVVSRTTDPAGAPPASTVTYLHAGGGDSAWGQLSGGTLTRSVGLPGGVTYTNIGGTVTWAFPDLRGHTLISRTGSTNSGLKLWDPFGQSMNPTTFALGTSATDDTGTVAGYTGWNQGALKQSESVGSVQIIEMGARIYVPSLGRFLQVDPVEGGVDNDYVWPTDPINKSDLAGTFAILLIPVLLVIFAAALVASYVSYVARTPTRFSLPTISKPSFPSGTVDRSMAQARASVKPIVIPQPQVTTWRMELPYSVYVIHKKGTDKVYKYGITSVNPFTGRPNSQLSGCAIHFKGPCDTDEVARTVGYYNARVIEYGLIYDYYLEHGVCPPGQNPSCK